MSDLPATALRVAVAADAAASAVPGSVNLLGLDREALADYCESLGEKRFRATQLFRWIHQKGVADFSQMSDLAASLRNRLEGRATTGAPRVASEQASADGTIKWLFASALSRTS